MGDKQQVITIAPKRTWKSHASKLSVQTLKNNDERGRTINARINDHFAYWPNGAFGIQSKRNRSNRGN